jgi:formylglycine-generating enzyme required for sulfatase activity
VYFSASGKTLALTGNIFSGNTASSYPVVYVSSGTVNASYNVVDAALGTGSAQSGWTGGTGNTYSTALPVSPKSFRLLAGSAAANKLPAALPEGYPALDFSGQPVSGGGAAGAVQAGTANGSGYVYLELSVNDSLRGSVSASPAPDEDGLVPSGSVTFTASLNTDCSLEYWLKDGAGAGNTNPWTINLSGHTRIQAVFSRLVRVDVFTDGTGSAATAGTLRHALTNARDGEVISLNGVTPGVTTIELESALPAITKSVTLEGNGVTLTRAASWTGSSSSSQLLYINSGTAAVTIRGVRFKDGLAADYGGAVRNSGTLTLESCIFSGNRNTGSYGGAVYSSNTLTIRSCTFYGNTSAYRGGAVYFSASGKTLTLTGNVFSGNTASSAYPVVYYSGTVSASYNAVDAALGTGSAQSGWAAGTGDGYSPAPLVSPKTFTVLYGSAATNKLPGTLPAGYPGTDFYGQPVSGGGAAGAVQAVTAAGYVYLELLVDDSLKGGVSASPAPDEDGFVPAGSVTLTATANPGYSLASWLKDGATGGSANPWTINLSGHTRIQAVFGPSVNIFTDGTGSAAVPGTLRYALTNARDGEVIRFDGVTAGVTSIALESALPQITKSVTLEGNGVTLTRAASWTASDYNSQLLYINSGTAEVTIRGVHFKDGLAANYGGAVQNTGTLTLESCIFSGNRTTGSYAYGGAVYSTNTLTIRGCTFYNNSTTSSLGGGAVFFDASGKTLTLTGNVFSGNTASSYPVVYYSGTVSASYNAVDAALGTGSAQSGWAAGTGDGYSTAPPVSGTTFKVLYGSVAANKLPGTLPADYPAVDFYGQPVSGGGAAGAVQAVTAAGYVYLELTVNNSPAGSVSANPAPDEDGLVPAGLVTLTASINPGAFFEHWRTGEVTAGNTNPWTINLSAHTRIQAVFTRQVRVDAFTDGTGSATTVGTLRHALTNAQDGDLISLSGVSAGTTVIELQSALPQITKSVTLEGNGVTLTRAASWTGDSTTSQLLYINSGTAEVTIRGVHFKDGLASNDGGAVRNTGTLTLESCIFSGNRTTTSSGAWGGAVFSRNTLTIRGCTFYNNTSAYSGGAVYFSASGKTLTLTGNVFYGNTASNGYPVVCRGSGTVSASYNVVDAALGTGTAQSGWAAGTGDGYSTALPVSPRTFKVLAGGPAANTLPAALPTDYPVTDFYGQPINGGGAAGAVQGGTVNGSGYVYLELSVNNSLGGSVSANPAPDADGLVPSGSVTFTATANPGYFLIFWLKDGVTAGNTNPWTINLSVLNRIQAFFAPAYSFTTPAQYREMVLATSDAINTVTITGDSAYYYDSSDDWYKGVFIENRTVTLSPFKIAKCETTYELWYEVKQWAAGNGYVFGNAGREGNDGTSGAAPTSARLEPVTSISWRDAVVWCNAYSEMSGKEPVYYTNITYTTVLRTSTNDSGNATAADHAVMKPGANGYRLPTEAQWEYAARGGKEPATSGSFVYTYAGSNTIGNVAWYAFNTGGISGASRPVGGKAANTLGLYDMSGNVLEWCWDCNSNINTGMVTDPTGSGSGSQRVIRGGAYSDGESDCAVSSRHANAPNSTTGFTYNSMGFRVSCP